MKKSKKQIKNFILKTLLPYKENPSTCGFNFGDETCEYLTDDGRKCAFGKWMKKGQWQLPIHNSRVASRLIEVFSINILLKPARDMQFTGYQWDLIQECHDRIADSSNPTIINMKVARIEEAFNLELPELKIN